MAPAPKPPKNQAMQAGQRLKVSLQSKLNQPGLAQEQKDAVYQGILCVERFLKHSEGTDADLEGLKMKIKRILSGEVPRTRTLSASLKYTSPAPATQPRIIKSASTTPQTHKPELSNSLSSSSEVDYSLPPIVIERQGRSKLNKFGEMARLQDKQAEEEKMAKKERARRMQMEMKSDLQKQMDYREQMRLKDLREKEKEAVEMMNQVTEWERLEEQKKLQTKEKIKVEKAARAAQVKMTRDRLKAERAFERKEDRRMMDEALAETAAIESMKKQTAAANKEMLKKVQEENIKRKELQLLDKEKEKIHDMEVAAQGVELAIKKEKQRQLELDKIQEKQKAMLMAGGADDILEARVKKEKEEAMRLLQLQAEAEEVEQRRLEAKAVKAKEDREVLTAALNKQLAMKQAEKEKDAAEKKAYAKKINDDHAEYVRKEADLKAHRKQIDRSHKSDVVQQMHSDLQRRYAAAVDEMNRNEQNLNKGFLAQIEGTKIA